MFKVLFTSLILILTNTVLAQAAYIEGGSLKKLEINNWSALYAGTTELDGLAVVATLENMEREVSIPTPMANSLYTLVPLAPVTQKSYRLSLTVENQPSIKVNFPLQARVISIDGKATVAYQSVHRPEDQFEFIVSPKGDGALVVHYRRLTAEGTALGEFSLNPIPQLMNSK